MLACLCNLNASASYILENDTTDKNSYFFVSNRNNTDGKYTMYKARENTSGISSCLIKGNFEVEDFTDMRQAEIVVYNLSTDELVGIYNTNPVTGNYLMVLELNVKYEFEITAYNHPPFLKTVEIPSFASTDISDAISTQKIYLKMQGDDIEFDLTTKIIEETTGDNDGTGRKMLKPTDILTVLRKTDIKNPALVLCKNHLIDLQQNAEAGEKFRNMIIDQKTMTPVPYAGVNSVSSDIDVRYTAAKAKRALTTAVAPTDRYASVFIDKSNTIYYLQDLMFTFTPMVNDTRNKVPRTEMRIYGNFIGAVIEDDRKQAVIIDGAV